MEGLLNNKKGVAIVVAAVFVVLLLLVANPFKSTRSDNVPKEADQASVDDLPSLSNEELGNKLSSELDAIMAVVNPYIKNTKNTQLNQITLFGDGSYCGVSIRTDVMEGSTPIFDLYKMILQKKEGGWIVVAEPEIVFNYDDYPDLPKKLIREIDAM